MFKRFWWVFLAMIPVGAIAGLLLSAVVTFLMPKIYESTAIIELKPPEKSAPEPLLQKVRIEEEIEMLGGDDLRVEIVDRLCRSDLWENDRRETEEILKRVVSFEAVRGSSRIVVSVHLQSKHEARDIAAEVIRAYRSDRERPPSAAAARMESLDRRILEVMNVIQEKREAHGLNRPSKGQLATNSKTPWFAPELSAAEAELGALQQELEKVQTEAKVETASVIVHQPPDIQDYPVSPDVEKNLFLGKLIGFLLSPLLALPVIALLNRLFPVKVQKLG